MRSTRSGRIRSVVRSVVFFVVLFDRFFYVTFFVIDIIIKEKFWNVWTDEGWFINLGRMFVDGEKTKIEVVNILNIN